MDWGANFWVWMATETFFGIFVAAVLYYFFVYEPRKREEHEKNKKNKTNP
jgi:hypothetical protein